MIQPYQLCNNRWEEPVTTKLLTFPCPWRIHFGLFVYIYLLIYHKHQPFMDREIHHSHGFYGMIVTPKPPFPTSGPPRSGKLQGFSCSVAVHEGIVLGTQVHSTHRWISPVPAGIAGTLRFMEGGWNPWVLRRVRLWISSSHQWREILWFFGLNLFFGRISLIFWPS